jgi:hypothetical protein
VWRLSSSAKYLAIAFEVFVLIILSIDLIAVLCPFGPLRLLIESSRNQQQEVPALLYSVNAVWFMAHMEGHFRISKSFLPTNEHEIGTNWIFQDTSRNTSATDLPGSQSPSATGPNGQATDVRSESPQPIEGDGTSNWINHTGAQGAVIGGHHDRDGFTRLRGDSVNTFAISQTDQSETTPRRPSVSNSTAANTNEEQETPPDEEDGKRRHSFC